VPLIFACVNGSVECADILLKGGARLRKINKHGISPIHAAVNAENNALGLLTLMIDHEPSIVNYSSPVMGTALHTALAEENVVIPIVELLLERGSDPSIKMKTSGKNALHLACERELPDEIILKILEKGGESLILDRDDNQLSALDQAVVHGKDNIAAIFLEKANIPTDFCPSDGGGAGCTPLFFAVQEPEHISTIKSLIDYGFSVTHQNGTGATPLHYAVSVQECEPVIDLLLEHGADINCLDNNKCTPAHFAVLNGNIKAFQYLESLGADMGIKNTRDRTASEELEELKKAIAEQKAKQAEMQKMKAETEEKESEGLKSCAEESCYKVEDHLNQFKRCSRCKKVKYCSQACQLRDWKIRHAKVCKK